MKKHSPSSTPSAAPNQPSTPGPPASPGATSNNIQTAGIVYAPYIPLYQTFGTDWKLFAYILINKKCLLFENVYEESIKFLNYKLNYQSGHKHKIPNMAIWELSKLKQATGNKSMVIMFRSFSKYYNNAIWPKEFNEGDVIPYCANITIVNDYKHPNNITNISDAFKKYYNGPNSDLTIRLKGKMVVINKENIIDYQAPGYNTLWKIIDKQNMIKTIIPNRLEAFEGSRNLNI